MSTTVEERLRNYTTRLDEAIDDYSASSPRDLVEPMRREPRERRRGREVVGAAAIAMGIAVLGTWWVRGSHNDVVIATSRTTTTAPLPAARVTVPDMIGLDHASLTTLLHTLRLRATVTKQHSETVPRGQVAQQEPAAGASVRADSVVHVVESSGPASSFDLLGGAPPHIKIDHVGDYVWTSRAVIPHLPDKYGTSYKVVGVADVQREKDRLVPVAGGYSLRVSFIVVSFSPGASLNIAESTAEGIVPGSPPTS